MYLKDEEEAGVIEQLKSQVCDNVGLYALKYDEEFQPYLPQFVTAVWNLLTSTVQDPKYDAVSKLYQYCSNFLRKKYKQQNSKVYLHSDMLLQLVSNALQFLATVADRAQYRHLFEDPTTLSNICEKVIIPNMEFRGNCISVNMIFALLNF